MTSKIVSFEKSHLTAEIFQEGSATSLWVKHFRVESQEHKVQLQKGIGQQTSERAKFTSVLTMDKGPRSPIVTTIFISTCEPGEGNSFDSGDSTRCCVKVNQHYCIIYYILSSEMNNQCQLLIHCLVCWVGDANFIWHEFCPIITGTLALLYTCFISFISLCIN